VANGGGYLPTEIQEPSLTACSSGGSLRADRVRWTLTFRVYADGHLIDEHGAVHDWCTFDDLSREVAPFGLEVTVRPTAFVTITTPATSVTISGATRREQDAHEDHSYRAEHLVGALCGEPRLLR
jgi:hypothetical protein